jgi:hypothetical protein
MVGRYHVRLMDFAMGDERRQSVRQKSFLRGCVYFNKRRSSLDCLIRDISDEGARIIFADTANVPDVVDLYIPHKEQTVRAHVQWRHGDEVGLAFSAGGVAPPAPGSLELAQRVAQLEEEIASLRKVIKRLKSDSDNGADAA